MREIIADAQLRRDMASLLRHALEKNHKLDPCQCSPCEKIAELAGADIIERACGQDGTVELEILRKALGVFVDCDLNEANCADLATATKRIRNIARKALLEARVARETAGIGIVRSCGETAWVSVGKFWDEWTESAEGARIFRNASMKECRLRFAEAYAKRVALPSPPTGRTEEK